MSNLREKWIKESCTGCTGFRGVRRLVKHLQVIFLFFVRLVDSQILLWCLVSWMWDRSRARFEHSTGRQHRKPHSEVVWIRPPGQQEAPFELLRPRAHVQLLKCKQCNVVVYASVCLIVCFDSSQPLSYNPSVRSSCSVYASMAQCHPHLFLSPSFEGFYAHRCICSVI